jgi:nicotinate phosphoribosyltransferase
MVRKFYDSQGITDKKTVVFSDSLDIEHCLEYKTIAEHAGFTPTFGVGTFFTSKFNTCALYPSILIKV